MGRWFTLFIPLLLVQLVGCRSPYNIYAPYGPQCVPPPPTGAVGQPYYAPPYGGYQSQVPGQPLLGQQPPANSQSSVFIDGGWSSSTYAAAPTSSPPGLYTSPPPTSSPRTPMIQPRPSGQLLASGVPARLQRNDNLNWGTRTSTPSGVAQASTFPSVPPSTAVADTTPQLGAAAPPQPQYAPPVPSVVRPPSNGYAGPVEYAAPTYYPNEYVLDPYRGIPYGGEVVTYVDPYSAESVGSVANVPADWAPRH